MARADAADPDAAAPALQLVAERHEDAGARGADGVAVGDGAAVDVDLLEHLLLAHPEDRAGADDGHRREGLVDLDEFEIVDRQVVLLENLLDRQPGHRGDVLRGLGDLGVVEDREQRLQAEGLGLLGAHEHAHVAAVVDARGVAGRHAAGLAGDGALVVEHGRKLGEAFQGGAGPRSLVLVEDDNVLALLDLHGEDLLVEPACLHGRDGAHLGLQGPLVLVLAGEAELVGRLGAVDGHVPVVEGVPEAVVDHEIHHAAVRQAHAVAPAHVRKRVGAVRHALLPAGDHDLGAARHDHLPGQVDRFDARRADLVDGDGGDGLGKPRQQGGLAARDLPAARRNDLSHDDVVHVLALHLAARAAEALLDGQRAQLRGVESLQGAAEDAVGSPAGFHADHLAGALVGILDLAAHARCGCRPLAELRDGGALVVFGPRLVQLLRYLFHLFLYLLFSCEGRTAFRPPLLISLSLFPAAPARRRQGDPPGARRKSGAAVSRLPAPSPGAGSRD